MLRFATSNDKFSIDAKRFFKWPEKPTTITSVVALILFLIAYFGVKGPVWEFWNSCLVSQAGDTPLAMFVILFILFSILSVGGAAFVMVGSFLTAHLLAEQHNTVPVRRWRIGFLMAALALIFVILLPVYTPISEFVILVTHLPISVLSPMDFAYSLGTFSIIFFALVGIAADLFCFQRVLTRREIALIGLSFWIIPFIYANQWHPFWFMFLCLAAVVVFDLEAGRLVEELVRSSKDSVAGSPARRLDRPA
jgi:uncharacterized membrane protein